LTISQRLTSAACPRRKLPRLHMEDDAVETVVERLQEQAATHVRIERIAAGRDHLHLAICCTDESCELLLLRPRPFVHISNKQCGEDGRRKRILVVRDRVEWPE